MMLVHPTIMRLRFAALLFIASSCGSTLDEFTGGGPEAVPFADRVAAVPAVAANGRGEMLLVWINHDDVDGQISEDHRRLYKSEFRDGVWIDPASAADSINATPERLNGASVVLAENGDAIIAWNSDGFIVHRRDGVWSSPFSVRPPDIGPASSLRTAINAQGDAIVAWIGRGECNGQPCCTVFRSEHSNGVWIHPSDRFDFISPGNRDLRNGSCNDDVAAAIADNGDAIIVWSQADPDYEQIFKSERRNGVWTNPSSLADHISPDGFFGGRVNVAMSANGDAILGWQQTDVGDAGDPNFRPLMMSEYRAGVWRHPADAMDLFAPVPTFYRTYGAPLMSMASNGDAIVAWGGGEGVFISEHRSGSWVHPLGTDSRINGGGPADISDVGVAMNAFGDATVVWSQSVNQIYRVFRSDYRSGAWQHPLDETDFLTPLETKSGGPVVALGSRGVIAWLEATPFSEGFDTNMLRRLWF
jgi:hypothetical protein